MSFFKKLLGYNTQTTKLLNIPTNEQIYRYPYKENVYLPRKKKSQKTKKQVAPKIVERTTFASEANRQTYKKLRAEGLPPDKIVFQSNFTNVTKIARKKEENERKKMLGNLYRPPTSPIAASKPYKFPPQEQRELTEKEKENLIAKITQSLENNNNNNNNALTGDPTSPRSMTPMTPSPRGGKRTRKHKSRRSTKRRGSRYTRKH